MSVCTLVCVISLLRLFMYLIYVFYLWNRSRNQPFTLNAQWDLLWVVFKAWPVSHLVGGVCGSGPFAHGERMFRVVKMLGSWLALPKDVQSVRLRIKYCFGKSQFHTIVWSSLWYIYIYIYIYTYIYTYIYSYAYITLHYLCHWLCLCLTLHDIT